MAEQAFVALLSILLLLEYHIDFGGVQLIDEFDTGSDAILYDIKLNSADMNPSWDIAYNSTHFGVTTHGKYSKVSVTATYFFSEDLEATICGDISFTRKVIPGHGTKALPSIAYNPDTACNMKADITISLASPVSVDICALVGDITVTPTVPITPTYPPVAPGASPLSTWQLLQEVVKFVNGFHQIASLQLEASFVADTAFHLSAKYIPTDGKADVSYADNSFPTAFADLPKPVKVMFDTLMDVVYEKYPIVKIALSEAKVTNGPVGGQVNLSALLPNTGVSVEFDVLIPDLKCNADGSSCNFPLVNGATITHIDANLDGYPEVGYAVRSSANDIDRIVNAGLVSALEDFCVPEGDRCTLKYR